MIGPFAEIPGAKRFVTGLLGSASSCVAYATGGWSESAAIKLGSAGTATRFWWGDDDAGAGDHAWYKGNAGGQTHPVGSKPSNSFGLYDMAGNVWQWTEDCYAESYANAPTDGSANEAGSACMRVDRGASWLYPTWLLRSAVRERNPADYRDLIMGFRLARTLP
jgi:formylglycine-generating enzyme required for sulfatase activity